MPTQLETSLYRLVVRQHQCRVLRSTCAEEHDAVDVAVLLELFGQLEKEFTDFANDIGFQNVQIAGGIALIKECRRLWNLWKLIREDMPEDDIGGLDSSLERNLDDLDVLIHEGIRARPGSGVWASIASTIVEGVATDRAHRRDLLLKVGLKLKQLLPRDADCSNANSFKFPLATTRFKYWQRVEKGIENLRELITDPTPTPTIVPQIEASVVKAAEQSASDAWEDGYLGLRFNDAHRLVRRGEDETPVKLTRLPYSLLKAFSDAAKSPRSLADLREVWAKAGRDDKANDHTMRAEISKLKNKSLEKLGLTIALLGRGDGWVLAEKTALGQSSE